MEDLKFKLYNELKITPRPGDKYKVLEDFTYKDITVPKGFHTNGADIPRIFWAIWPPNRSDYLSAVVIHDYLCDLEEYEKADEYFREILQILEIGDTTTYLFYNLPKMYHKIKYKVKYTNYNK